MASGVLPPSCPVEKAVLHTALVNVKADNITQSAKVLFDTGSEVSLIFHRLANNLNAQLILKPMNVTGTGSLDVHCKYITSVELYPVGDQK